MCRKVVRNPMIEKPNKDGKTQTIEYQEEEILVSIKCLISFNEYLWSTLCCTNIHITNIPIIIIRTSFSFSKTVHLLSKRLLQFKLTGRKTQLYVL